MENEDQIMSQIRSEDDPEVQKYFRPRVLTEEEIKAMDSLSQPLLICEDVVLTDGRIKSRMTSMIGKRFGKLTVNGLAYKRGYNYYFDCTCDCGIVRFVRKSALTSGHSKSCGCARKGPRKHLQSPGVYARIKALVTRVVGYFHAR